MAEVSGKTCETCKREFKTEQDFLHDTTQWHVCSAGNLWFNCNCGSTLMIPKGKYEWYDPGAMMSTEAASVFNRVTKINELPHIPAAVMQIQQLLQDPDSPTKGLGDAVRRDPFLAAEVLRVAEGLRRLRSADVKPMASIEHAITYIGRKNMGDLVLAASIRAFKLPTSVFDEKDFWNHSFLTAAITEVLATKFAPELDRDKVYLAGCLANIGKIISAICFPEKTDMTQEIVKDLKTMTTWERAEKECALTSHSILGEIGAALWGLPRFVVEAARHHHTVFDHKKGKLKYPIGAIVGLANIVAHWVNLEPSRIDPKLLDFYKRIYGTTDQQLEALIKESIGPIKASLQT